MDDAVTDDRDSAAPPEAPVGYLTLVARLWIDTDQGDTRIRGSLTDAHTGAQLPLDLTEVVAFLRGSFAARWGERVDQPPY